MSSTMTSPLTPLPFLFGDDLSSNVVDVKNACGLIKVVMINDRGVTTYIRLPISELAKHFDVLPGSSMSHRTTAAIFRDLKIFTHIQRFSDLYFDQDNGEGYDTAGFPKILPRPGTDFYLVDLFFLKIFCRKDYCLVLDCKRENTASAMYVKKFVEALVDNLASGAVSSPYIPGIIREIALTTLMHQRGVQPMAFELMVLDTAIDVIEKSFWSHFNIVNKILRRILEDCQLNPSDKMGRRVLAFKKAIVVFANRVDTFKQAIIDLLSKDSDMVDLFLSQPAPSQEHEEVELILEGYKDGLHDLHLRINGLLVQISDTWEFINTHLDEARNRIMRMSLVMEMCMLGVSTGAVISGIFGMNLKNGLEDLPIAFYGTTITLVLFAILVIIALMICLRIIEGGKRGSKNYHVLRNFMAYVDDIVGKLRSTSCGNKSMMASEFESFMKKLVGQEVISDVTEETDLLFKIFDANRTGKIDPDEVRILTNSDASKRTRKASRQY